MRVGDAPNFGPWSVPRPNQRDGCTIAKDASGGVTLLDELAQLRRNEARHRVAEAAALTPLPGAGEASLARCSGGSCRRIVMQVAPHEHDA